MVKAYLDFIHKHEGHFKSRTSLIEKWSIEKWAHQAHTEYFSMKTISGKWANTPDEHFEAHLCYKKWTTGIRRAKACFMNYLEYLCVSLIQSNSTARQLQDYSMMRRFPKFPLAKCAYADRLSSGRR
jgi:hypothetical protein